MSLSIERLDFKTLILVVGRVAGKGFIFMQRSIDETLGELGFTKTMFRNKRLKCQPRTS